MGAQAWFEGIAGCNSFVPISSCSTEAAMPSQMQVKDYKDSAFRCWSCCCHDNSLTSELMPACVWDLKTCCLHCGCQLQEPFFKFVSDEEVMTKEEGFYQGKLKCLCLYQELQCPPGPDIGVWVCGIKLYGDKAGREILDGESYAPIQETM